MVPALVAGTITALTATTVALWLLQPHAPDDVLGGYAAQGLLWTAVMGVIGVLVLRRSPGNRLGQLFCALSIWLAVVDLSGALQPLLDPGTWGYRVCAVVNGLWIVAVPVLLLVPQLYPDGRPLSARWRVAARITAVCVPVSAVALLISPDITQTESGTRDAVNPFAIVAVAPVAAVVAALALLTPVLLGLAALVAQLAGVRHLEGEPRARVGWLLAFFVLVLVAVPCSGWLNVALQLAAAGCLMTGVVRHHLFDIQRVLSRSVTYAILVVAATVVALLTAALLGSLSDVGVLPVLAAALTALLLASGFSGLQRAVDVWVYGPRRDPAAALGILGDRLAAVADVEDVLPLLVSTLRESLQLQYAAITLAGETEPAAAAGTRGAHVVGSALRYGGQDVGLLELGPRAGEVGLSERDARLVGTFAAQAGTAAHSAQTLRELRRSREALVTAREEERRMLRRDLHDGLGPTLAGITLGLESLQRTAPGDATANLAAELERQSRLALDEVRRLARDLRPAPLDELGLEGALRHHAAVVARLSGGRPDVRVVVTGPIPDLPAAVEVAAYRITQEAVSNSTRHAGASRCVVELSADGALVLSVRDDGTGARPSRTGTGLRSMRDRADELGGACTVAFEPGVGTVVRAELPISGVRTTSGSDGRR